MALLLERCVPGTSLAERLEPEQDFVIAGLLRRLWIEPAPSHPFRPLQVMCDQWADGFERHTLAQGPELDAGLVRDGLHLVRTLPGTAHRTALLAADLHAGNVVAAERRPWLLIDPEPYVGDRTYDVLQHLLNCPERLLLWLFARCEQESRTADQTELVMTSAQSCADLITSSARAHHAVRVTSASLLPIGGHE